MPNKISGSCFIFLVLFVSASATAPTTSCLPFAAVLNFANATISVNNLGGQGPNEGQDEELRYSNVGMFDDEPFDLVVTVATGSNYEVNNRENGKNGDFGIINLKADTTVDLNFQFQDANKQPLNLKSFYFSFFDLDQSINGNSQERLCIDDGMYHSYHTAEFTQDITVERVTDETCSGESGASTTFTSKKTGFGCDNPTDPLKLEVVTCETHGTECSKECNGPLKAQAFPINQLDRSVEFEFHNQDSWAVSFSSIKPGASNGGRNILFAGRSALSLCPEPTPNPTKEPTAQPVPIPTKQPVPAPTKQPVHTPTKQPIHAPTKQPVLATTKQPVPAPTKQPVPAPTKQPVHAPTKQPVPAPTKQPVRAPTKQPVPAPTKQPVPAPTKQPVHAPTKQPVHAPTKQPVPAPTKQPVHAPTKQPAPAPTKQPVHAPTKQPVPIPTKQPVHAPTMQPVHAPTKQPVHAPTKQPVQAPAKRPTLDDGACFHGNGTVLLQSGTSKPISELIIGEFIKTHDAEGNYSFSPVIKLPHVNNNEHAVFLTLKTETGKEVDMTSDHHIPKCDLNIITAGELLVGDCLLTANGKETLIEISWNEKYGVYTAITEDNFIVVDGVVASPFSKNSHPEEPELDYEKYRLELQRMIQRKLAYSSRKAIKRKGKLT